MKRIIQKRIIPARTQCQDEKFSNQSTMWSTKVRSGQVRSGQVRSGHNTCCLYSFLKSSLKWVDGFKKFHRYWVKIPYFTTVWKLFSKMVIRSGKCIMSNSIQVLPSRVSKNSFYTFEDIDLRESQSYKKTEWNSGSRLNLKVRNQYLLSSSEL